MRPPARTNRILKWTGAGLSALTLGMWMLSQWCEVRYRATTHSLVWMDRGMIGVVDANVDLGLALIPSDFKRTGIAWHTATLADLGLVFPWQPYETQYNGLTVKTIIVSSPRIALWFPILLIAIPTAWLWHRDRRTHRFRTGHCTICDYNLMGNTTGICPECGDRNLSIEDLMKIKSDQVRSIEDVEKILNPKKRYALKPPEPRS